MREILFRGKREDNNKWVEGCYVYLYDSRGNKSHRIYPGYAETDCEDFYPDQHEIDSKTLGQYTGLIDKNGIKIFEGDIIKLYNTDEIQRIVRFGEYNKLVGRIYYSGTGFYSEDITNAEFITPFNFIHDEIEVIGNIYDNLDFLKETMNNV